MKKEEFYREAIPEARGALEGIRILEATTAGAGPWCATFLVDMGASAGYLQGRSGNRVANRTLTNAFACKDGYVYLCIVIDSHWAKLCRVMGREDLIGHPRTATMALRSQNNDWLEGIVNDWLREKTAAEVLKLMDEAALVAAPIYDFSQVIADPHIREREMVAQVEHPTLGPVSLYGVAPELSRTPGRVRTPAPLLGQHNEEVYGTYLDYGASKLEALQAEGLI